MRAATKIILVTFHSGKCDFPNRSDLPDVVTWSLISLAAVALRCASVRTSLAANESVSRAELGSRLVDEAGETIREVVQSVKRIADIESEISSASEEQRSGVEQVNQSVAQMDQVTQQNAALVEEAAAAAQLMPEQAATLRDAMAIFKIRDAELPSTTPDTALADRFTSGALWNRPQIQCSPRRRAASPNSVPISAGNFRLQFPSLIKQSNRWIESTR